MHLTLDLSKGETDLSQDHEEYDHDQEQKAVCEAQIQCPELTKKPRKHFLKFYLDVSYYLCVIPYKIVPGTYGEYKKDSWILQKIICVAIHLLAIIAQLSYFRSVSFGHVTENPKVYFDILVILVHIGVITAFVYSVWNRADTFRWLIRAVNKCPVISLWYPKKICWVMSFVTLMYVTMALINPMFEQGDCLTWSSLLAHHISAGRGMFFLSQESHFSNMSSENDAVNITATNSTLNSLSLTAPNIFFALFSYICCTSRWLVIYHVDLLVNVMALSLWVSVSFFVDTLKAHCCKNTITKYEALKQFANHINCAAGLVVLAYTVDSILYYATNMESLFTGKNWFSKITVIQFLMSSICWFHFASAACLKMDKFREWIRQKDNSSVLPSKSVSMMLLLDEIATNTVGLSGNGLFIVNYQFVAQALTTVMTYFILVIQFKSK